MCGNRWRNYRLSNFSQQSKVGLLYKTNPIAAAQYEDLGEGHRFFRMHAPR